MRPFVLLALAVTAVAGLGYLGWDVLESRREAVCDACGRPAHHQSALWAEVQGRRKHFCCAGCALWAHRQTGEDVEITRVADYVSGASLDPSEAVFVVGGNVNLCLRHSAMDGHSTVFDQSKEPGSLEFDRCSPSILAFADRAAASKFADREGGSLMTYGQLRVAFR